MLETRAQVEVEEVADAESTVRSSGVRLARQGTSGPSHGGPYKMLVLDLGLPSLEQRMPELMLSFELAGTLLGRGARVVIATERSFDEIAALISKTTSAEDRRRLHVLSSRGQTTFDHRGRAETIPLDGTIHGEAVEGFVWRTIAKPLGIEPDEVLVLDGELDRMAEILEAQIAYEDKLGPFAPPRDPLHAIVESGFDVAREHEIESLLAIANGYLGSRGSVAEGSSVSRPATFLAGTFEPSSDVFPVPELVIAPDWGRLRFTVGEEPFHVEGTTMERHHRILDLKRGLLLREGLGTGPGGHTTLIRTMHLASLARRHLLLEAVEIVPQNFTGTVTVEAILSGDVKSGSGSSHWESFEPKTGSVGPMLFGQTKSGLSLALASLTTAADPGSVEMTCAREIGPVWATERCGLHVKLGEASVLHRVVGIYTSRDGGKDPLARAEAIEVEASKAPWGALLEEHVTAWQERWKKADVEIDGAPSIERALRFALYHLMASVHPDDPRCSLGARALSGEAYRGHVFWDTEIFMLPFFVYTWPEAARTLLQYRYRTLDGARRKAKKLGYEGALFAWESADTGDETTPEVLLTPFGELLPVLSGLEEHHISADVAYAVIAYARVTGDERFLREEGAELLVETARLWATRGAFGEDGKYHIKKVIGPDEYHESIDDNAFTNWMARLNLRKSAQVARGIGEARAKQLGVTAEEIARWEQIAQRMYLGDSVRRDLIEQHAGFFSLEDIRVADYEPRTVPMDVLLGRDRTRKSQLVKQSDVVQLVALLWEELDHVMRLENFLYYEPRTGHGSSLSPGIHALVAARLGLVEMASRYLTQTAEIDLGNNMGNAAGGVHAAGMGSLWQAVVFGVAGISQAADDPKVIVVEPSLLPGMRRVSVPVTVGGQSVIVHACRDAIEVQALDGERTFGLRTRGAKGEARITVAEPLRNYVCKRDGEGFSSWEEDGRR